MGESKKGSRRKRKGEKKPKQKEWWKRKGAQQKNIWVTLLIKLSVKFKNPTAFYLWAWKDERSKEQKVVTFMFIHKCFEGTYLCLTTSFSTWKYKHKLNKGFEVLSYAEVPAEQGVLSWGRKVPAVLEEHECKEAETEDVSFNPLSFAYAKSLTESIGGICLGMPGKFLAWPVSIVWSLSVSQLCWPRVHLVSTHLLGLEGWKWMQQEGRDQAEEALLTPPMLLHPQCCCAQEEMLLQSKPLSYQWKCQIPPHQLFLGKVSLAEKSSTVTGHKKYPKRALQARKLKIHGIQCTLSRLDCLHGPSLSHPWDYIALSLTGWLYSADTLQHCSGLAPPRLYPESSTEFSMTVSTSRELERGEITNLLSAGMCHKYPSW